MTHTYSKLTYHLVWSTKNRQKFISNSIKKQLYAYIKSTINQKKCFLTAINGMEDHVHLLLNTSIDTNLSDLVKTIKISSSKWLKKEFPELKDFSWQEGFGVFTVGYSTETNVKNYILNQEEHHKTVTFDEEYTTLLNKLNIKYDNRFVLG